MSEARDLVLSQVVRMGDETALLVDAAERVLAENLVASRNIPPWNNSAMDGYAVLAADLVIGRRLEVIESIAAGRVAAGTVGPGQAIKIMTGAPVPAGADTILPVELVTEDGANAILVREGPMKTPRVGDYIRAAGEDVKAGETVVRHGEVMTPAAIGVAASLGRASVRVVQRPRVAILSTGDEIAEVGGPIDEGQIYGSNAHALAAAVRRIGALPVYLGIARDTPEDLSEKLRTALDCDALLTTGGVSIGDHDHVKEVLESLGVEMKFWRVAQRPGHPLAFGLIGSKPVFGLPGNPVSTMVSFEQYAQPALLKMMGRARVFPTVVDAVLEEDVRVPPGRFNFIRGVIRREGNDYLVRSTGAQGSGILSSLLRGNALLLFPPESTGARAGETIRVQVIDPNFWLSDSASF